MKKTIALLLALALVFGAALPAFAGDRNAYLAGETSLASIGKLKISTGGKAKQLVLQWSAVPRADGYQILRSTTGKTGSYKRIAEESATSYTDAGLKNSTVYYYAVRAYAWTGTRTVYSPLKKANLSTRITKSFASYRYVQAWKAMDKFTNAYDETAFDKGTAIQKTRGDWYGYYLPFTLKGCSTKADAVKYLSKFFTKAGAKSIVNFFLKVIKGKLYIWLPEDPSPVGTLVINDIPTLKIKYGDTRIVCKFGTWYIPLYGAEESDPWEYLPVKCAMDYENGRWVFEDDGWYNFDFSYISAVTPNDGP